MEHGRVRGSSRGRALLLRIGGLALFLAGCGSPSSPAADASAVDAGPDGPSSVDAAADAVVDVPAGETGAVPADQLGDGSIDISGLPRLPRDKTFTTRYAAGAGSVVITPDHDHAFMGGFGLCIGKPDMCKYSQGVHDDLKVQAAALADTETGEVVILAGVDSIGLLHADIGRVQKAATQAFARDFGVGFPGARLVVAYSHVHAAPDTIGLWGSMLLAERDEEEYIAFVRDAILQAALAAYGDLGDAVLDRAVGGTVPNHGEDTHAKDEDVLVLRARRPAGEAVFHLVRWAAHPTIYWYDNHGISADYVGTMRKRIEETAGGLAVFLNGPIGSIYPTKLEGCTETDAFPDGYHDPLNPPEEYAQVSCVGDRIADQALAALETDAVPIPETGLRYRFAEFWFHPTNMVLAAVLKASPLPIEVPDVQDPASLMKSQYSWITIGDLDVLTTPGESFPHFALHAKEAMGAAGLENIWIVGAAQDYLGYLMSAEQYMDKGLEYWRTLSPGELVEPAFLASLEALLEADAAGR